MAAANLQKIQADLLRTLRGRLSSSALSAKLGYSFNQVARWEKSERRLLWSDFVSVCEVRKLPLREQVELYLGYKGDLRATGPLTKTLLAGKPIGLVSKSTRLDRSKISRWLSGKAEPTFLDVYLLLRSGVNLLSFLEPLVELSKVPSLAKEYSIFRHQRELAYSMPYLDSLMEALLLQEYQSSPKHEVEILSHASGLSPKAVASALSELEAAGMVEKKNGKYQSIEIAIDYRADKLRMRNMILHWLSETAKSVERLPEKPLQGSLIGFSVFSLSREGHERALTLFREFNRAIHALGSEDSGPKEKVLVLVNSLIDAANFKKD